MRGIKPLRKENSISKIWKIIKGIFWVAIIFAAIFIIFTSLNIFGYQMFVVKSGSMEPKIHTGSVVIDHKEGNYKIGDVITFKLSNSKDTITHRIVKVDSKANAVSYQVKGDANETPDVSPVMKANVVGKVNFSIPFLGYLIAFIRTLPGLIIFVIIPALIIIAEEMGNIKTEAAKLRATKKKVVEEVGKIEQVLVKEEKLLVKSVSKKKKVTKKKPTKKANTNTSTKKKVRKESKDV